MRAFPLPTICDSVATRCQYWWGVLKWTSLNMFQSWPPDITGRGAGPGGQHQCPMFRGGLGPGDPYLVRSHVPGDPCMVRSNASWVMVTWGPTSPLDRHTRLKTLPSRNFVGGHWKLSRQMSWGSSATGINNYLENKCQFTNLRKNENLPSLFNLLSSDPISSSSSSNLFPSDLLAIFIKYSPVPGIK